MNARHNNQPRKRFSLQKSALLYKRKQVGWRTSLTEKSPCYNYVAICSVLCQESKLVLGQYFSFKLVSGNEVQDKWYNIFPAISNLWLIKTFRLEIVAYFVVKNLTLVYT